MAASVAGYVIAGVAFLATVLGLYGGTTWRNGPTRLGWALIVIGLVAFGASIIKEKSDYQKELKTDQDTAKMRLSASAFLVKATDFSLINGRRSKAFAVYTGRRVNLHGFNCRITYVYRLGELPLTSFLESGQNTIFSVPATKGAKCSYVNIDMMPSDTFCQGSMAIEGGEVGLYEREFCSDPWQ
jgi:hypothetical protein